MAFPQVATSSTGLASAATSHVITMPSGVVSGDLVLVHFANDAAATVSVSSGTGWTQLGSTGNGVAVRLTVYWKVATGSGDNLTLDTSATEASAHTVYRITGHDAATAPEGASDTDYSTPNPPNLDPSGWGAEDTLWIAAFTWDNTGGSLVSHSEASNQLFQASGGTPTNACSIASSTAESNASSRNPADGEVTSSPEGSVAFTIAVRPAATASTFPQVVTSSTGISSSATSHPITMPSGVVSGDLVLVAFGNDGIPTVSVSSGTGWTELRTHPSSTAARCTTYYKIATGSGDNLTLDTSAATRSAHAVYRITGHHASTPPESTAGAAGSNTAPDANNFNPTNWDVENTLWIAAFGWSANQSLTVHSLPDNQVLQNPEEANGAGASLSSENVAAASKNPLAGTLGGTASWSAFTIAVRPASGDGGSGIATILFGGL